MTRPYTGYDGNATGKRAGLEKFVELTIGYFNRGVWNNGTWSVRMMNNPNLAKPRPSVHSTGRAADLSWRKNGVKGFGDHATACQVLDFWTANADLFLIEEMHDYFPLPHGRGWRCDRAQWKVYDKPSIGSPGGDWFHVEIAPQHADNPAYYEQAFASLAGAPKPTPSVPASNPESGDGYPGVSLKVGSKGEAVKKVQAKVGAVADGDFGQKTKQAVIAWQTQNPQCGPADGIVGKQTWKAMFG